MKKTSIFFLSLIIFFFTGCSKKDNDPVFQSYLRFKLDGVQIECTEHIRASYLPPTIGPDNVISISGNWPGGAIEIHLNENTALSARQYLFEPFTWRTGEVWTNGPNSTYHIGGSCLGCPGVDGSGRITFLEVSPGYVRGTFEYVTGVNPALNTFKTVTNGEFYIKRG